MSFYYEVRKKRLQTCGGNGGKVDGPALLGVGQRLLEGPLRPLPVPNTALKAPSEIE
jgi:hypothetical protein